MAVPALKQSLGAHLPRICALCTWEEFLGALAPDEGGYLLDRGEGARPLAEWIREGPRAGPMLLVVGPESGLTDSERAAALAAGLRPEHLGPQRLRFETAAVAALAVVRGTWGAR